MMSYPNGGPRLSDKERSDRLDRLDFVERKALCALLSQVAPAVADGYLAGRDMRSKRHQVSQ